MSDFQKQEVSPCLQPASTSILKGTLSHLELAKSLEEEQNDSKTVSISIARSLTVQQVIDMIATKFESISPLPKDLSSMEMRLCDDDEPDLDFPPLNLMRSLLSFDEDEVVICTKTTKDPLVFLEIDSAKTPIVISLKRTDIEVERTDSDNDEDDEEEEFFEENYEMADLNLDEQISRNNSTNNIFNSSSKKSKNRRSRNVSEPTFTDDHRHVMNCLANSDLGGFLDCCDDPPVDELVDKPMWLPNSASKHCMHEDCSNVFGIGIGKFRRHHCRACGRLFCIKHSSKFTFLPHLGHLKLQRVCNVCNERVLALTTRKIVTDNNDLHDARPRFITKWTPKASRCSASGCTISFSIKNRKHHCRACGHIFCQLHSSHLTKIPQLGYYKPVRVCDCCHALSDGNGVLSFEGSDDTDDAPSIIHVAPYTGTVSASVPSHMHKSKTPMKIPIPIPMGSSNSSGKQSPPHKNRGNNWTLPSPKRQTNSNHRSPYHQKFSHTGSQAGSLPFNYSFNPDQSNTCSPQKGRLRPSSIDVLDGKRPSG
eukprot:TRINITY_DN133210_c0_g1_i2.p1 TRINITY_DN133210_c0_g1~~TRINITY_DN133210_c0_g1_i2.p1  ORF type:complete len:538 (-),score=145.82 TRINITY_DN133210_c0_g1_i2:520-2133(-)